MADDFKIEFRGAAEFVRKVKDPRLVGVPVRRFFERAGTAAAGNVRERTPVDTGRLRNSITNEVDGGTIPSHAKIGTNVAYARPVEYGSKPHFPPLSALQPWARRHGFPGGNAGAFLVARAIARKGTKPREMFQRGLAASLGTIRRLMDDMGRDIERRWRG